MRATLVLEFTTKRSQMTGFSPWVLVFYIHAFLPVPHVSKFSTERIFIDTSGLTLIPNAKFSGGRTRGNRFTVGSV